MYSWFPVFVSLPQRPLVANGEDITLHVIRMTTHNESTASAGGSEGAAGANVAFQWRLTTAKEGHTIAVNKGGWAAAVQLSLP
jgi:hypothetical protein